MQTIFKRLIKDEKDEIFHSSAYGRAQNGAAFGTASTSSYANRRQIDAHRHLIKGYDDSIVANQRNTTERAATYEPTTFNRPTVAPSPIAATPGQSTPVGAASSRNAFNAAASNFSRTPIQKPSNKQ